MQHIARKRFGQNFLHDPSIIGRIAQSIAPRPDQHLVEIGPGLGAITSLLLPHCAQLDAVELDRDLVAHLQQQFANQPHFRLHSADALEFDFCTLSTAGEKLRVVGNLPYNISTPILFHLLDQSRCIQDMHFMLQKEVVERMAAAPGNKTYGRLSVMLQLDCQVEHLFDIGPGAFTPAPKVDSSFVRLTPKAAPIYDPELKPALAKIVSAAFAQRRKTLHNNLKGLLSDAQISDSEIDPAIRAEQLSPLQFVRLALQYHNSVPR